LDGILNMSCDNQVYTFAIPGPAGAAGAPGVDGTNGVSAYTTAAVAVPQPIMPYGVQRFTGNTTNTSTTVTFADTSTIVAGMSVSGTGIPNGSTVVSVDSGTDITISAPATVTGSATIGFTQTVTINVTSSTAWIVVGMILAIRSWGYLIVSAVPSDTSITVYNPEDPLLGLYDVNVAQGTPLTAGYLIAAAGIQGPAGTAASGAFEIANNLSEGTPATIRSNLGLGTAALVDTGVTNTLLPTSDITFTYGNAVFATATGLQTKTPLDARTALNLGSSATTNIGNAVGDLPYVDNVAGLTNGDIVFATALGVETKTAANARSALGVTALDYMLYRDQTGGAAMTINAWTTVPLDTEVVDEGGHGSLAGSIVTLAAGTYRYRFGVVNYKGDFVQGRLYDTTVGAAVASSYGQIVNNPNALLIQSVAPGEGVFTIAVPSGIRLEAATNYGSATFGTTAGILTTVYSFLEFWKE
jgi:hypothetical protein